MINLINKLANIFSVTFIFIFFTFAIYKNLRYKTESKKPTIEENIEKCIDKTTNTLKSIECIGTDVFKLPINEYKKKLEGL